MKDWEVTLANLFKDRDNPKPLGAILGKIVSLEPLKISIQDGKFFIDRSNCYVCNQLLERKSDFDFTADQSQSGQIKVSCEHGGGSYDASGDINATGKIHLHEVWKMGDMVMVQPDESGQHFFIVDIVKGVE